MAESVLTNALLVLPDAVVAGSLVVRDGRIAEVQPGRSSLPGALDCGGDHLIPGIVDLHTDNLERQVEPRAGARWPSRSAMLAHDAQTAAAGVTTVLDALCLGDLGFETGRTRTFRDGVADLDALAGAGLLRCEHFLHLRCEVPAPDMPALVETVADHPRARMASLMDHSPGCGQYADLDRYRAFRRRGGLSAEAVEARIAALLDQRAALHDPQRAWLLDRLRPRGLPLASHDDLTPGEVARNHADGIGISEFPVRLDAALAARALGLAVIAGAPNVVRGGSHSGNVAALDLVRAGAVHALASDYVPAALAEAAWLCAAPGTGPSLPEAVAMVTDRPARLAGFDDRGRIAPGLRADLVRVRLPPGGPPVVRATWVAGERAA